MLAIATCISDPARFPFTPNPKAAPTRAAVPHYRMLQNRIGTTRVVIVTPSNHGVDNRATVDAITQLGADARGVAVLHAPTIRATHPALTRTSISGIWSDGSITAGSREFELDFKFLRTHGFEI